jgi:hypothetical protein
MPQFIVTTDDGSGTERLPNGKHAHFEAIIVDETGAQVYLASLELNAKGREEIAASQAETERALDTLVRAVRDTGK